MTPPEQVQGGDSETAAWRTRPVLTIDTSSSHGSVALYDGQSLSTRSWPAGRSHSTTLLSEIHHLLDTAKVEVASLAAIGVQSVRARSPVSALGSAWLRVSPGHGHPLIAVSTLEATAMPFAGCGRIVVPVVAAGRGRLTWAPYSPTGDGLQATELPRNSTIDELAETLRVDTPLSSPES